MEVKTKPRNKRKIVQTDFVNIAKDQVVIRERLIDLAKGITVIIMVITHVIALAYDYNSGTDPLVYYIGIFGGIASFTSFLLLSGINNYISYLKIDENDEARLKVKRRKVAFRFLNMVVIYLILASLYLVIFNKLYEEPFGRTWLTDFYNAFTVGPMPAFSEFIIPLAFFMLTTTVFFKFYKRITNSIYVSILVGTTVYIIGTLLFYLINFPIRLDVLVGIFVGKNNEQVTLHTFPLFQYFIVFLLGIAIGKFLEQHSDFNKRILKFAELGAGALGVLIISIILYSQTKLNLFNPIPDAGRFPPSYGFIALSLLITFIILIFAAILAKRELKIIDRVLGFISKKAIAFFFFHLVLLFIYEYLYDTKKFPWKPNNILEILLVLVALILITTVIVVVYTFVYRKLAKSQTVQNLEDRFFRFVPLLAIVILIVGGFFYVNETILKANFAFADNINTFERTLTYVDSRTTWWDDDFQFRRFVLITNNNDFQLPIETTVAIPFDHSALVSAGKTRADGKDITVVYWDETTNSFKQLPILLDGLNTSNAKAYFNLQNTILPKLLNENYIMYYGSIETVKEELTQADLLNPTSENIIVGEENAHVIQISSNRKWFLRTPSNKTLSDKPTLEVTLPETLDPNKISLMYEVTSTDGKAVDGGELISEGGNKYRANPNIDNFDIGTMTASVKVINLNNTLELLTSYKLPLRVSYPMYVTWTIDWDGWDVSDWDLNRMANQADSVGMPMVQLFNPRIYVKEQTSYNSTSPERAQILTNWVLRRGEVFGDEIGLHMHMFADMVSEAGVVPRGGRAVGAMYGDAITSDFDQPELERIYRWGLEKFEENDLPMPYSYRAGGWFAAPHVLKALENVGLQIDSSGRTGGRINPALNYSTVVPWDLQVTTRPYKPNVADMNKAEGARMGIWEIPNNGADSYWFTENDLIGRFQQNYTDPEGVMRKPQVLTYLTHPHWYTLIDEGKMRVLFQYLDNYKYEADKGPIIYTTLKKAYDDWDKISDINGN